MKALQDLQIFIRTAETGSFSATARILELSPAAISAAIKRLEAELKTQLFLRTTRSLRLTPKGEQFLSQCQPALEKLRLATQALHIDEQQLHGYIRLSAPSDLGRNALLAWLHEFQLRYPAIQIDLHLSDRISNMYKEAFDAAIRYGKPADSNLVALSLHPHNTRVLCAAPEYLERAGIPTHPSDLSEHACLCFMLNRETHDKWSFSDAQGKKLNISITGAHISNDGEVVRRWAKMGKGIAYKAHLDIVDDLRNGSLVAVCTEWQGEASPLNMMIPSRQLISPALRLLREFLAEQAQTHLL